jgi:hypothetical protein
MYRRYLKLKTKLQNSTSALFNFGTFFYKGIQVDGTCNNWQGFYQGQLLIPTDDIQFTVMQAHFQLYSYATKTNVSTVYSCPRLSIITGVINALNHFGSSDDYEANCDGNSWRVYSCDQTQPPLLCVNCKKKCVPSVTCPGNNAFMINPCQTGCNTHAVVTSLLNFAVAPVIYYPTINGTAKITNVTRSTATVAVGLLFAGIISCAAFPSGQKPISLGDIQSRAFRAIADSSTNNIAEIEMNGLLPLTSYQLYCFTSDFANHIMPFAEVLPQTVFTTLCCREINILSAPSSVVVYSTGVTTSETPFQFSLNSLPASTTTKPAVMKTKLSSVSCTTGAIVSGSSSDAVALPSYYNFTSVSTSLTGSFVVRGSVTGCYRLSVFTTGPTTYKPLNTTFAIRGMRQPPPVPKAVSAVLSSDGQQLSVSFDFATDQGFAKFPGFSASSFNCSKIFQFQYSAKSSCSWINSTTLVLRLPIFNSFTSISGTFITVLGGVVRAECLAGTSCGSYPFVSATTLKIQLPTNVLLPTVVLTAISALSPCDNVQLDPTLSTGSSGQPWKSIQWTVSSPTLTTGNASVVENYLDLQYSSTLNQLISIPINKFAFGNTYTFVLTLTNWLGGQSAASVNVQIASSINYLPLISIVGTQPQYYVSNPVILYANVTLPTCLPNSNKKNATLTYEWRVYNGLEFLKTIRTNSLDARYFKSNAYTFNASSNYAVQVFATFTGTSLTGKSMAKLSFVSAGVQTKLNISSQTISTNDRLVIDGSGSLNLDFPSGLMTFSWSCKSVSNNFGNACGKEFIPSSTGLQSISSQSLPAGVYEITVLVKNLFGGSGQKSCIVTIVNAPRVLPVLTMSTTKTAYNPTDKILVSSTLLVRNFTVSTSFPGISAAWSAAPSSLNLTKAASTPSLKFMNQNGLYSFALSFSPGILTAGWTYSFILTAQVLGTGTYSQASVSIKINQPPYQGILSITPSQGMAVSTQFYLQTTSWVDDPSDFPLSYAFGYQFNVGSTFNLIKQADSIPYFSSTLAQGSSDVNFNLVCMVQAYDIYNGFANATQLVTVNPPKSTTSAINQATNAVNSGLANQNPVVVNQALSVSLSTINIVSCNPPGVASCSAVLHREACTTVPNTCGPCNPGYIGIEGSSNSPCNLPNVVLSIGANCTSNTSCITGFCKKGNCAPVPKTCTNNCNQHGICQFVSLSGKGLDSCDNTDATCTARCLCNSGFYGSDCSLSQSSASFLSDFFAHSCYSLHQSIQWQDSDSSTIQSRASLISKILTTNNLPFITFPALMNCSLVLIQTVNQHPADCCQSLTYSSIVNTFSAVLQYNALITTDLYNQLQASMNTLVSGCQSNIALGESPLNTIANHLRIVTFVMEANKLQNQSILIPRSEYEKLLNLPSNFIRIDGATLGTANGNDPILVSVRQSYVDPTKIALNSSVITITTLSNPSTGQSTSSRSRRLSEIDFDSESPESFASAALQTTASNAPQGRFILTIQNNEEMDFKDLPAQVHQIYCWKDVPNSYFVNFTCPLTGHYYEFNCPNRTKGYFNVTCPGYTTSPQCLSYNGLSYVADSTCYVMEFNNFQTTCSCGNINHRRLAASSLSSNSSSKQYAVSTTLVRTDLKVDFVELPKILEVKSNSVVSSSFYVIILLFLVGGGLFGVYDFIHSQKDQISFKKSRKFLSQPINQLKEYRNTLLPVRTIENLFNFIFPDELRATNFWLKKFSYYLRTRHSMLKLFASESRASINSVTIANPADDLTDFTPQQLEKYQRKLVEIKKKKTTTSSLSNAAALLLPPSKSQDYKLLYWMYLVTKALMLLFVSVIIIYTFFPDNKEICESISDDVSCENKKTMFDFAFQCQWVAENRSCINLPPTYDFLLFYFLSLLGMLLYIVLISIIDWCHENIQDSLKLYSFYAKTNNNPISKLIANTTAAEEQDQKVLKKRKRKQKQKELLYHQKSYFNPNGIHGHVPLLHLGEDDHSELDDDLSSRYSSSLRHWNPSVQQRKKKTTASNEMYESHPLFQRKQKLFPILYSFNEFSSYHSSWFSRALVGVKLEKMKELMDNVSPQEESLLFLNYLEDLSTIWKKNYFISFLLLHLSITKRYSLTSNILYSLSLSSQSISLENHHHPSEYFGKGDEGIAGSSTYRNQDYLLQIQSFQNILLKQFLKIRKELTEALTVLSQKESIEVKIDRNHDLDDEEGGEEDELDLSIKNAPKMTGIPSNQLEIMILKYFFVDLFSYNSAHYYTVKSLFFHQTLIERILVSLNLSKTNASASSNSNSTFPNELFDPKSSKNGGGTAINRKIVPINEDLTVDGDNDSLGKSSGRPAKEKGNLMQKASKAFIVFLFLALNICLWGVGIIVMLFFVYFYGSTIGERSLSLLTAFTILLFVEEFLLLEPLIIWLKFNYFNSPQLVTYLTHSFNYLMSKSKMVLTRKRNFLNSCHDFIQHFNLGCRLARYYSFLSVSKWLILLNDYDIPMVATSTAAKGRGANQYLNNNNNNEKWKFTVWFNNKLSSFFSFVSNFVWNSIAQLFSLGYYYFPAITPWNLFYLYFLGLLILYGSAYIGYLVFINQLYIWYFGFIIVGVALVWFLWYNYLLYREYQKKVAEIKMNEERLLFAEPLYSSPSRVKKGKSLYSLNSQRKFVEEEEEDDDELDHNKFSFIDSSKKKIISFDDRFFPATTASQSQQMKQQQKEEEQFEENRQEREKKILDEIMNQRRAKQQQQQQQTMEDDTYSNDGTSFYSKMNDENDNDDDTSLTIMKETAKEFQKSFNAKFSNKNNKNNHKKNKSLRKNRSNNVSEADEMALNDEDSSTITMSTRKRNNKIKSASSWWGSLSSFIFKSKKYELEAEEDEEEGRKKNENLAKLFKSSPYSTPNDNNNNNNENNNNDHSHLTASTLLFEDEKTPKVVQFMEPKKSSKGLGYLSDPQPGMTNLSMEQLVSIMSNNNSVSSYNNNNNNSYLSSLGGREGGLDEPSFLTQPSLSSASLNYNQEAVDCFPPRPHSVKRQHQQQLAASQSNKNNNNNNRLLLHNNPTTAIPGQSLYFHQNEGEQPIGAQPVLDLNRSITSYDDDAEEQEANERQYEFLRQHQEQQYYYYQQQQQLAQQQQQQERYQPFPGVKSFQETKEYEEIPSFSQRLPFSVKKQPQQQLQFLAEPLSAQPSVMIGEDAFGNESSFHEEMMMNSVVSKGMNASNKQDRLYSASRKKNTGNNNNSRVLSSSLVLSASGGGGGSSSRATVLRKPPEEDDFFDEAFDEWSQSQNSRQVRRKRFRTVRERNIRPSVVHLDHENQSINNNNNNNDDQSQLTTSTYEGSGAYHRLRTNRMTNTSRSPKSTNRPIMDYKYRKRTGRSHPRHYSEDLRSAPGSASVVEKTEFDHRNNQTVDLIQFQSDPSLSLMDMFDYFPTSYYDNLLNHGNNEQQKSQFYSELTEKRTKTTTNRNNNNQRNTKQSSSPSPSKKKKNNLKPAIDINNLMKNFNNNNPPMKEEKADQSDEEKEGNDDEQYYVNKPAKKK